MLSDLDVVLPGEPSVEDLGEVDGFLGQVRTLPNPVVLSAGPGVAVRFGILPARESTRAAEARELAGAVAGIWTRYRVGGRG